MRSLVRETSFQTQVESALADYLNIKLDCPFFSWEELPGTGSTSVRSLVRVNIGNRELRFVIKRYQIQDQPIQESHAQAKREYDAMVSLSSRPSERFCITPVPIKFLSDHAAIIMEFFSGRNVNLLFWQAVRKSAFSGGDRDWILKLIDDIVQVFLNIQRFGDTTANIPLVDKSWYLYFLEQQIEVLRQFGISSERLDGVQQRVENHIDLFFSNDKTCFQHTDLTFNNLLYNDGTYCVLDLSNSCIGTRYWDISHLLVTLDHYELFFNVSNRIIAACKEEFSRWFVLDPMLIQTMKLIHYSFSLKLSLMAPAKGLKKLLTGDAVRHYEGKIDAILKEGA